MAIQPPQRFELDDLAHVEREARTIYAPGATPGDVLVVQSDHSLVAAPGGGSQPSGALFQPAHLVHIAGDSSDLPLSGAATIDGIAVTTGDRLLILGQADPVQNGLWVANTEGAWTRPADFTNGTVVPNGALFVVGNAGAFWYSSIWILNTDDAEFRQAVVGTDSFDNVDPIFQYGVYNLGYDSLPVPSVVMEGLTYAPGAFILPTDDPQVAGALWNDAGTPAISTGPPPP